ncbi:MAG: TetR/AcrR family transcriptional regulator [Paraclostridium bifermentans]|uniref:TetR family transcriptional regulator n=1 Tax=Paraclostridium bifermentans TaxID=1490 RepID=UPI001D6F246B|nr:TetR family transcriptional regulator [Paraclostridium bifermentans]MBS6509226.1 TetR/AcrR family transcriptional regulator [Paraclostridium bifermentans]MDU3803539.1 TetR family transcriptional regulator [Paraclostridium bifermentans]
MQHKNDLRIIKTNNNIRNTFVQLLNEKDFNSITVKDILDRALINRSTFYKYYTDKYNLAEVITQVFLNKFRNFVDMLFINANDLKDLLNLKDEVLKELYSQKMTILGLWKVRTDKIHVYDDMHDIIKHNYVNLIANSDKDNHDIEYESYICASTILATLRFILENQTTYTVQELSQRLENFYNTFLKNNSL